MKRGASVVNSRPKFYNSVGVYIRVCGFSLGGFGSPWECEVPIPKRQTENPKQDGEALHWNKWVSTLKVNQSETRTLNKTLRQGNWKQRVPPAYAHTEG